MRPACTYSETDIDVINRFRSGRYEAVRPGYVAGASHGDARPRAPLRVLSAGDRRRRHALHLLARCVRSGPGADLRRPDGVFVVRERGICSTGSAWPAKTRHMGARSILPTPTTCSPVSGAAWDPGGAGRMVVRAGYGMYFDQTQVEMFAQNVQESFLRSVSHGRLRQQRVALESRRQARLVEPFAVPDSLSRSQPATGSWRLDGSTGTSACSGACTPAA